MRGWTIQPTTDGRRMRSACKQQLARVPHNPHEKMELPQFVKTTPISAIQLNKKNTALLRSIGRVFFLRVYPGSQDSERFAEHYTPEPGDVVIGQDQESNFTSIEVYTQEHQEKPYRGKPDDFLAVQDKDGKRDRYVIDAETFGRTYAAKP